MLVSWLAFSWTLKMETCSFETSVDFQRTTRRCNPEARTLHNHRCEILKFYTTELLHAYFPNSFVCYFVSLTGPDLLIKRSAVALYSTAYCIRWNYSSWPTRYRSTHHRHIYYFCRSISLNMSYHKIKLNLCNLNGYILYHAPINFLCDKVLWNLIEIDFGYT
jgi:hypothetical protein